MYMYINYTTLPHTVSDSVLTSSVNFGSAPLLRSIVTMSTDPFTAA